MKTEKIFAMPFASVYPHYITKAEKKGRSKQEVDQIIIWLTGYDSAQLNNIINQKINFKSFF